MSQILSDRLSIKQIAQRWAAETDNAGFGAEDLADDLVNAAVLGEFEHLTHSRADAPLGQYTYEEFQEDGTVEIKETAQPGVGPYRSALSMRDGHPVNAVAIRNYIGARHDAAGATDQETRRAVASDIFLSVEGLRRWCDESGFVQWAKLRGLSRPKFIKPVSREPLPTTTVGAETKCMEWLVGLMETGHPKKLKHDYQEEAETLFNVGSKAFGRAWANAAAETGNKAWTKPGPRS